MVVSNSTPLIVLSKIGRLNLLRDLFHGILIPAAVGDEILRQGVGKPGVAALLSATWLEVRQIKGSSVQVSSSLDNGEAEALKLAYEIGAEFDLMDDQLGRREAKKLGLRVVGTIGILQLAKARKLIPAIKPELDALLTHGFFVSDVLYAQALLDSGESQLKGDP